MNEPVSQKNWQLSLFSKTHLGYQYFPGEHFSLLRDNYSGCDDDGECDDNGETMVALRFTFSQSEHPAFPFSPPSML